MKRGFNTVEEEFLKYGNSSRDSFGNEEYSKFQKGGGSGNFLSKIISILAVLVLAILLLILAKVGYMFFFNPADIEKIVKTDIAQEAKPNTKIKNEDISLAVQQKSEPSQQQTSKLATPTASKIEQISNKTTSQEQKVIPSTTEAMSVNSKSEVESSISSSEHSSEELADKLAQALKEKKTQASTSSMASSINEGEKRSTQTESKQEIAATTSTPTTEVAKEEMSDEELVKMLLDLEPDQLKKIDIKKLLLEKEKKRGKEVNKKVVRTAYLNNQAIISTQKVNKKEESLKLSQEVGSLLQEVQNKKTKEQKEYIEKIQSEVKTREKTMRFYVVQPGDSLSKIARKIYGKGSDYIKIYEANQDIISNPRLIYPGQKLRIPEI